VIPIARVGSRRRIPMGPCSKHWTLPASRLRHNVDHTNNAPDVKVAGVRFEDWADRHRSKLCATINSRCGHTTALDM